MYELRTRTGGAACARFAIQAILSALQHVLR